MYPLHQAAPMGFAGSAGWAQAVTDAATSKLPKDKKVAFDTTAPQEWPVWGSILDDIWTIEERQRVSRRSPATTAWLDLATAAFNHMGVPINHNKTVDDGVGVEFQGAVVHGADHWLGCSVARRVLSTASAFTPLGAWEAAPLSVERLCGKLG